MQRPIRLPQDRVIQGLPSLTRIERLILEHITRYRITTRRGWRGAWELRDFDDAVIARTIRRLVSAGILRQRILYGSIHAFELDVNGTDLLGLPVDRARAFSEVATVRAYAHVLYATTGARPLLLADGEIQKAVVNESQNSGIPSRGGAWGFFFDPEESQRWSQLIVDRTFSTNTNRVARRLHGTAVKLLRHPIWNRKIREQHFSLAVITPSRRRAERILNRFSRYDEHEIIPLTIMVAPGLIPLVKPEARH